MGAQVNMEETIARLERQVDELSDELHRQGQALAQAERRIALLMEREAQREADGGVYVPGERPPHY